jgi:hypothetical protein
MPPRRGIAAYRLLPLAKGIDDFQWVDPQAVVEVFRVENTAVGLQGSRHNETVPVAEMVALP